LLIFYKNFFRFKDAAAVKKVLTEAGAEVNEADLTRVITALSGKALHEVIAAGLTKVGTVSTGAVAASGNANAPGK
jgi:ribosomal protein L12E/L44/L45/RPP1/RPP2